MHSHGYQEEITEHLLSAIRNDDQISMTATKYKKYMQQKLSDHIFVIHFQPNTIPHDMPIPSNYITHKHAEREGGREYSCISPMQYLSSSNLKTLKLFFLNMQKLDLEILHELLP